MRTIVFLIAMVACAACGASSRQTEIRSAYFTVSAAEGAFHAYDIKHQIEIAQAQPDQVSAQAAVTEWIAKRNRIDVDIGLAVRAIAAAAAFNDQPSLDGMTKAVKIAADELAALGVKL